MYAGHAFTPNGLPSIDRFNGGRGLSFTRTLAAAVGAIAWTVRGWPACAALVAAMLVLMAAIIVFAWSESARQEKPSPIEPP